MDCVHDKECFPHSGAGSNMSRYSQGCLIWWWGNSPQFSLPSSGHLSHFPKPLDLLVEQPCPPRNSHLTRPLTSNIPQCKLNCNFRQWQDNLHAFLHLHKQSGAGVDFVRGYKKIRATKRWMNVLHTVCTQICAAHSFINEFHWVHDSSLSI